MQQKFEIIKLMRERWIPGSLSPPPREPGYKAIFTRDHVQTLRSGDFCMDNNNKRQKPSTLALAHVCGITTRAL